MLFAVLFVSLSCFLLCQFAEIEHAELSRRFRRLIDGLHELDSLYDLDADYFVEPIGEADLLDAEAELFIADLLEGL